MTQQYVVWGYNRTSRTWLCNRFNSLSEAQQYHAMRVAESGKVKTPCLVNESYDPNSNAVLVKIGAGLFALISIAAYWYFG